MLSECMTDYPGEHRTHDPEDDVVIVFLDVSRAHMFPVCTRDVYMTTPAGAEYLRRASV